jgi:hypothetical protein
VLFTNKSNSKTSCTNSTLFTLKVIEQNFGLVLVLSTIKERRYHISRATVIALHFISTILQLNPDSLNPFPSFPPIPYPLTPTVYTHPPTNSHTTPPLRRIQHPVPERRIQTRHQIDREKSPSHHILAKTHHLFFANSESDTRCTRNQRQSRQKRTK